MNFTILFNCRSREDIPLTEKITDYPEKWIGKKGREESGKEGRRKKRRGGRGRGG